MTPEFLLTSLIVVATPGTGVVVTLAAALARGRRAAVVAALGCTLGIVPHMAAAATGLAALLQASALAFEVIRYAGVLYLLYMAWSMLRQEGPLAVSAEGVPPGDGAVILSAILANLLNPKLTLFFFAFLPQFVGGDTAGAVGRMLALSGVFMAMTFAVFVLYGMFAAAARRHVLARPRIMTWLRRVLAAGFLALGGRLALAER